MDKDTCCYWQSGYDINNEQYWKTDCGHKSEIEHIEEFEYCPFCGRELALIPF